MHVACKKLISLHARYSCYAFWLQRKPHKCKTNRQKTNKEKQRMALLQVLKCIIWRALPLPSDVQACTDSASYYTHGYYTIKTCLYIFRTHGNIKNSYGIQNNNFLLISELFKIHRNHSEIKRVELMVKLSIKKLHGNETNLFQL